jgi:PPOX class probable F420-dependent enzyme
VARLATAGPGGRPHVVPVVFAAEGDVVWTAVDHKPKRTRSLQRLANARADPRVSLLADHYEEDWDRLWWVRADGVARVLDVADAPRGMELLTERYPVYRSRPPEGPVMEVAVQRWTGWSATG